MNANPTEMAGDDARVVGNVNLCTETKTFNSLTPSCGRMPGHHPLASKKYSPIFSEIRRQPTTTTTTKSIHGGRREGSKLSRTPSKVKATTSSTNIMSKYQFSHRGKSKKSKLASVSKEEEDWLDSVCTQATHSICPVPKTLPATLDDDCHPPDALDHVFDEMERKLSFVNQVPPAQVLTDLDAQHSNISGLTKQTATEQQSQEPPPAATTATDKDALDHIFERVEHVACGIPMGTADPQPTTDPSQPPPATQLKILKEDNDPTTKPSQPLSEDVTDMEIRMIKQDRTWWIWAIIATLIVVAIICFGLVLIFGW